MRGWISSWRMTSTIIDSSSRRGSSPMAVAVACGLLIFLWGSENDRGVAGVVCTVDLAARPDSARELGNRRRGYRDGDVRLGRDLLLLALLRGARDGGPPSSAGIGLGAARACKFSLIVACIRHGWPSWCSPGSGPVRFVFPRARTPPAFPRGGSWAPYFCEHPDPRCPLRLRPSWQALRLLRLQERSPDRTLQWTIYTSPRWRWVPAGVLAGRAPRSPA